MIGNLFRALIVLLFLLLLYTIASEERSQVSRIDVSEGWKCTMQAVPSGNCVQWTKETK